MFADMFVQGLEKANTDNSWKSFFVVGLNSTGCLNERLEELTKWLIHKNSDSEDSLIVEGWAAGGSKKGAREMPSS